MKSLKDVHSIFSTNLGVCLLLGAFNVGSAGQPEKVSESALQQIRALEAEKLGRSPQHRKLDSQFVFKLKQKQNQPIAPGVTKLQPDVQMEADGRVMVDIEANVSEGVLAQIRQSGGTVLSSVPQFHAIRALMTLEQVEELASRADVKFIRRAVKAQTNTGSVTSEGDVTHRANVARSTFGISGQGVKVGVLSDSIDYLANSQASGDLGDVTVLPGQAGCCSGEGTAMLEIIHDLAPGAQLFFATAINGEASFAQNILNLRSNGCDIIVDDVGYFDESPFQDGVIAQAVNSVTASGALYFSAAGNQGNFKYHTSSTWEGDFVDGGAAGPPVNAGGGRVLSFAGTPFNTVLSYANTVNLFWSDPLGASTNDYDMFVLDSTGSYVLASSLNLQNGTQDPYESISYVSQGNRIVIVKASGDARFLHLEASSGNPRLGTLSISTTGATRGHSAAAAAFSVAAVNAAVIYPNAFTAGNQNPVEAFSSDGPRRVFFDPDGTAITPGDYSSTGGAVRQKPDLTAADGVRTTVFYQFSGTSAAAPHAAAIAALMLSYNHNLTPNQVRNTLTSTALDIESPGVDINSGAGIVMADAALLALPPIPVISASGSTLVTENCPNGVVDPGETVTVALNLANSGLADTTNLVATLLGGGGITSPSGPQSYGKIVARGSTVSRTFSFTGGSTCGGTNIATLRLQDGANDLGTVSFAFPAGIPRLALVESFDGVTPPALPSGWTTFQTGFGAGWGTITGFYNVDTPPNSASVIGPNAISDNRLTSPSLPIVTASAQVSFRHSISTYYYGYNGGVLEISTNGGPFLDILAAGGSFALNGYYSTLYYGYGNPIEGRQAWTGYSGGFITTIANLPASAAGQNVQFRWRFGTSSSYGYGDVWYLDTIMVRDGLACCTPTTNDLVVSVSDLPDPVVLGGNLTYTIHVLNTGPSVATGVTLADVLPDTFDLQSISVTPGVTPGPIANGGGTLNFSLGSLAAGASANVTIVGVANSLGSMTNRVSVGRAEADANTNNNTATTVTTVIPPALSINDVTMFDGSSGLTNATFNVSLSPPPFQSVTVEYNTADISARAGIDYLSTHGILTFAPGATNLTISVPVIGSTLNQPTRQFVVNLSNPVGASMSRSQGIGTILNDDPLPILSVTDVTLVVPNAGTTNATFNFKLNTPSGQTVSAYYYTSDGTAHSGIDYVPFSGQLIFNPGETNQTISIAVNPHVSSKPAQTFSLYINGAGNVKLARDHGLATILTSFPGQIDHFRWDAITSPQSNSVPFGVAITAQDYWNTTATNFNGTINLQGFGGAAGNASLVVGVSSAGDSSELSALRSTLTALGHEVRSVSQGNWSGLDVVLSNPGSSIGPSLSDISSGVNYIQISDWGSDWTPNTWSSIFRGANITLSLGTAHAITAGLPAFWTSHGFWHYGGSSSEYVGWSTDGSLPSLASEVSVVQQSRVLVANELGAGRAVYVGWNVYGPDASTNDITLLRNALQWVAKGLPQAQPIAIFPKNSGNFVNGKWIGTITVGQVATNVTLRADDGNGHYGLSLPFDVRPAPGQATQFAWNAVASPQSNGVPFSVTLIAQDYLNGPATNFTGKVTLSGTGSAGASRTNTILGNVYPVYSGSGAYTFGYAFTPRTNITVTALRHYFGIRVSIWTDAGIQVVGSTFNSTDGSWSETPLSPPVLLQAGQRYRVGIYTGANRPYYWRTDLPSTFPDGTIDQSYQAPGLSFPTNSDSAQWWLVDLKYTVDIPGPVPVAPANSDNFTAGVWNGSVAVLQAATNVTLIADDGFGHVSQSLPFNVLQVTPAPGQVTHFSWGPISSPQSNGVPIPVMITAQDYLNNTATNFMGTVAITAASAGPATNSILNNLPSTAAGSSDFTLAYAFIPNTNLLVTHVRHYSGTKVSIWKDDGTLLATQPVISTPGTWMETPLPAPLNLAAGVTYRVGFYTASGPYYWNTSGPGTFPNGTLVTGSYYSYGDAFPTNFQANATIYLTDLRYAVAFFIPISSTPNRSDPFLNGVWVGNMTIAQGGNNNAFLADDGLGHSGLSRPFDVARAPIILTQPQSVTNFAGSTTGFSVAADGTSPLSYQWLFNDTIPVQFATNAALTLAHVQLTNAGRYKVVVSNQFGSAVSSNALLTVQTNAFPLVVDFNSDPSNLLRTFGSAYWSQSGDATNGGYLALTDAILNQHGAVVFNELLPGQAVRSFRLSMDVRIGGGTTPPADGLSISFARPGDPVLADGRSFNPAPDGSDSGAAEEGTRTGVSVCLDSWQNGNTDVIGIGVRVNGVILAQYPLPTLNGAANDPTSIQTGPVYDLSWVPLVVTLYEDGTLEIYYKGFAITPPGGLQTHFVPGPGQFVLGARTGGADEVHHVDNISFTLNFPGSPATTVHHLALSKVPSPQFTNLPFQVTVQAQNVLNGLVTNFSGTANISAITNLGGGGFQANFETGLQGFTVNNSFGNGNGLWHRSNGHGSQAGHSASSSIYYGFGEGTGGGGSYNTVSAAGYPTPNEGVITSPPIDLSNVTNPPTLSFNYLIQTEPGSDWDQATVEISADGGSTFDVVAGNNQGGIRFTNDSGGVWRSASISLSNYVGSQILVRFHFNTVDGYSNNYEGWYVDDVLVNAPLAGPITVFPASTGNFTNGTWTGTLSIPLGAPNVTLLADDGNSHTGTGNPFSVLAISLVNDLSLTMSAPAGPVPVGANLSLTMTISNRGPAVANGVTVTNLLPAGFSFVSASSPQGSHSQTGGVVRCDLGPLPGATSTTITIVAVPGIAGTTVTNVAFVSRSEVDPYLGNNTATATTVIGPPAISIADGSVLGNNLGQTNILFPVTLSAPSAQLITVNYSTADGSAIGGADYDSSPPSGPVTFNAGVATQTISVVVYPHVTVKPSQAFYVKLNNPVNASLTRTQAVGTILTALPGYADHFVWSGIASPQVVGGPFAVTLAAQDYLNNPATSFSGPANLSAAYSQISDTNILGTPPLSTSTAVGNWTFGYAFTPTTYINVTHVRHYFGTKVSIWTDAGLLLVSQNVSSIPGTWVETPLASPILLAPGTRYRVATYSAGGSYYWRTGMPGTFSFGTIDQGYGYPGDGFPNGANLTSWAYVDLRFTATGLIGVPISPTSSGSFAGGFWSGTIAVLQAATNVVLSADDGLGHFGQSLPFNIISAQVPPVTIFVQHSGNQVLLSWPGGILQSATQATGPYSDIVGANSPYAISPSGPRQFFRVRVK
jgi:uncharacterized repeat protein (TIGR01451 family)